MRYPYQGRDLFSLPENYFYAECTAKDFLSSWLSYRENIIEKLESVGYPDPADYPSRAFTQELSKTGKLFLKAQKINNVQLLAEQIQRFVVKYEINKRLYAHYDKNLIKVQGSELANIHDYIVFGECLTKVASEMESIKHLSTLMKLCDALCSVFIPYPLSLRAVALLKTELQLVENVYA